MRTLACTCTHTHAGARRYYGHNAIARLLIDAGAKVSVQANNGCTAFDIASIIGDTEVVRLLAAVSMAAPLARSRGAPLRQPLESVCCVLHHVAPR